MLKQILLAAGVAAGALALGACSHAPANGKTRAQVVNGGGNGSSGKMICVRQDQTGSHISGSYCMTPSQYKQYQKAQQESQQMFQRKNESTAHPKGCSGPNC